MGRLPRYEGAGPGGAHSHHALGEADRSADGGDRHSAAAEHHEGQCAHRHRLPSVHASHRRVCGPGGAGGGELHGGGDRVGDDDAARGGRGHRLGRRAFAEGADQHGLARAVGRGDGTMGDQGYECGDSGDRAAARHSGRDESADVRRAHPSCGRAGGGGYAGGGSNGCGGREAGGDSDG